MSSSAWTRPLFQIYKCFVSNRFTSNFHLSTPTLLAAEGSWTNLTYQNFTVLPPGLTDEPVTFVTSSCRLSRQNTGLDLSKSLKDALDVVVRQVGVDRCHVDPVKGASFLCQLVNDRLSLADVTRPSHLREEPKGMTPPRGRAGGACTRASVKVTLAFMFRPPRTTEFICSRAS